MSWATAGSAIFVQAMLNPLTASAWSTTEPTTYGANGLSADTINVALFNNTSAPSKTVTAANSGYSLDQWVTGNEVTDATNWVAGGRALASKTFAIDATATNSLQFGAANLAGGGVVTLTGFYGCLVYDATITVPLKQGLCFNYFGGTQTITGGTFTILWATPASATSTAVFNLTV